MLLICVATALLVSGGESGGGQDTPLTHTDQDLIDAGAVRYEEVSIAYTHAAYTTTSQLHFQETE